MTEVLIGVATAIVTAVIFFFAGRFSIKTKTQAQVDIMREEMNCQREAMPIIMKCLLALLVAAKAGKINGECDIALKELNEYFIKNKQ